MQLDIWNAETPTRELPRLNCTNDETCTALADEHIETCPVEQRLRDEFGF
jgi:hypothetical protein